MKSKPELIFNKIVKESFHKILKPQSFKKRNNNFYRPFPEVGHIINIQKNRYNTKDNIEFTMNLGVFSPIYWMKCYNYKDATEVPKMPHEYESIIRHRIGELIDGDDVWFTITDETDEDELIMDMISLVKKKMIPYFDSITNNEELLIALENDDGFGSSNYKRFLMLAELDRIEDAKKIYPLLLKEYEDNKMHLESIKSEAAHYKIN